MTSIVKYSKRKGIGNYTFKIYPSNVNGFVFETRKNIEEKKTNDELLQFINHFFLFRYVGLDKLFVCFPCNYNIKKIVFYH